MSTDFEQRVSAAAVFIRRHVSQRPSVGLILGSGLGGFADSVTASEVIRAEEIPGYPISSVPGHAGQLLFGQIRRGAERSPSLLVFKGRVHYYESADFEQVVLPIALAHRLGVRTLLITNAAGGINSQFLPGDLMIIHDVMNLGFKRPLTDHPTHTDGSALRAGMDPTLTSLLRTTARLLGITVQQGVYCWLQGPTYETAAEIQMLRRLGADAVGMSTVPEILMAASRGMRTAGISLISNFATGIATSPLSHDEVTETADRTQMTFTRLMTEVVLRLPSIRKSTPHESLDRL